MGLGALFHRNCVGVELLDGELRLAEIRGAGRRARVARTISRPLPAGLVTAGEVQEPETLGVELRRALREGRIRSRRLVLAAPDSRLLCRTLSVPPVRDRQLLGLVEYEVSQSLQIPFQNPVWDYAATPLVKGGESRSVLVTAVPGEVVDGLRGAALAAGLKPVAMETASLALRRLLNRIRPAELKEAMLVVQLSPETISLHIFRGPLLVYTRFARLERPAMGGWGSGPEEELQAVTHAAAAEMEQALRFYLYSLNGREQPVEQVWLASSMAGSATVAEGLARALDLPVMPLAPGGALAGLPGEDLGRYAVAIGLALKGVAA